MGLERLWGRGVIVAVKFQLSKLKPKAIKIQVVRIIGIHSERFWGLNSGRKKKTGQINSPGFFHLNRAVYWSFCVLIK